MVFKLIEPDRGASPPMLTWQLVEGLQVLYPADGVVLSLAISSSGWGAGRHWGRRESSPAVDRPLRLIEEMLARLQLFELRGTSSLQHQDVGA